MIKGLLDRAHKLCNNQQELKEELELITNTFIANGYPPKKVDEIVLAYKPQDGENSNEEEVNNTLCVPYLKGVSERLEKIFRKGKIIVVYKRGLTAGNLICNAKPKKTDKKNVIYRGIPEMHNMWSCIYWRDLTMAQYQKTATPAVLQKKKLKKQFLLPPP